MNNVDSTTSLRHRFFPFCHRGSERYNGHTSDHSWVLNLGNWTSEHTLWSPEIWSELGQVLVAS